MNLNKLQSVRDEKQMRNIIDCLLETERKDSRGPDRSRAADDRYEKVVTNNKFVINQSDVNVLNLHSAMNANQSPRYRSVPKVTRMEHQEKTGDVKDNSRDERDNNGSPED